MKRVILTVCLIFIGVLGYAENFKGTDKEFFEKFNPNFDTFTRIDGSIYTGKIEVIRSSTNLPWFKMDIKDGKKHGKAIFYFKDGKVKSETNYDKGRITGRYVFYNGNGKVLYETVFKNGNGLMKDYTEDGILTLEIEYSNGVKHGKMTTYNLDGTVKNIVNYTDGREVIEEELTTADIPANKK